MLTLHIPHTTNPTPTQGGDFGNGEGKSYTGRNVLYGIREHAMGAIMNGFAYFGLHQVRAAALCCCHCV